jgi:hypothetical protein
MKKNKIFKNKIRKKINKFNYYSHKILKTYKKY